MFASWLMLSYMFILCPLPGSDAAIFTFTNYCHDILMMAILDKPQLSIAGFALQPAESRALPAPNTSWSARIWGRTLCSTQDTALECSNPSVTIHGATLMEVTLDAKGVLDSYSIHFVRGYNLPIAVLLQPDGTGGNRTDCSSSLGTSCASAKYLVTFCPVDSSPVDEKRKKTLLQALEQVLKLTGIAIWVLAIIKSLWGAVCYFKGRRTSTEQLPEAASTGITMVDQLSEYTGDVNA